MFIKNWNNWDMNVIRVTPVGRALFKKDAEKTFSKELLKEIEEMAKVFGESVGLVFRHNLIDGWEEKLLESCKVTNSRTGAELKTKQEIQKALTECGDIEFHTHKENGSSEFIKTLEKPPEEQWS